MNDNQFLYGFLMLLSFFALLYFLEIPINMLYIQPFDIFLVASSLFAITVGCVIVTGIPCALAVTTFGIIDAGYFMTVPDGAIKIMIFTPMIILFLFVLFKFAKGSNS